MFILTGYLELILPYSASLKEKRKIIQSIIARNRKRFNISICEVDYHDLWQRTKIGFAAISGSKNDLETIVKAVRWSLDYYSEIEVSAFEYDLTKSLD
ncbi:MAG: DUF503 domain-containing protein [Syntrophomonadaceae bacterium]|jgi:uncharacterized protein YlxP (DUF503 family)|nr:DUF503 domain-containing protein [Syntrophomonadaceae bacterium]